ncbi:PR domain zinc finger protein 10-like isoform X1 [Saccostrea echinata]|uniref:PR domain zinc finger protein 10-like isoform X1 n=1 Tax=Saccostrea echinata TaxID=191078 RepID=UPI002A7FEE99|nr:PR domain zinc finger protein 10-like isoform X1 [Saccostrea echinata]
MEDDNSEDKWMAPDSTNEAYPVNVTYTSSHSNFTASTTVSLYNHPTYNNHFRSHDRSQQGNYDQSSYQISPPQQFYQPTTSSTTYDRLSPTSYREIPTDNEAISYSSLQPQEGSQLISSVDSSTISQMGYQMHHVVMDADRLVTVQRVVSPVDCSAGPSSVSSMSHQESLNQLPTHTILTPVPVSSIQGYATSYNEVTVPKNLRNGNINEAIAHEDQRMTYSRGSVDSSRFPPKKKEIARDIVSGDADTTRDDRDLQNYQSAPHVHGYILEDDQVGIHSTMVKEPGPLHHNQEALIDTTQSTAISFSSAGKSLETSGVGNSVLPTDLGQLSHHSNMRSGLDGIQMYQLTSGKNQRNEPDSLSTVPVPVRLVRKSSRIAEMENEPQTWRKPKYKPGVYNYNEIWCDDCSTTYATECPTHKLTLVPDKVVLSRAWSSLPPLLQIFRIGDPNLHPIETSVGVFAKRTIQKNVQFGPFVGELVTDENAINGKFPLAIERGEGDVSYFDTSDENKCNWMMFVRPAESYAEQNCVAYQYGLDIYFTVTRNIEAKAEIKVWYAPHYAERFGFPKLEITDQDIQTLDDQENKFVCYECTESFRTQMALQKHIMIHEVNTSTMKDTSKPFSYTPPVPQQYATEVVNEAETSTSFERAKKLKPPKKTKDIGETYMWKKKSTSFYLNKTLKKYKNRQNPEQIRKNLMNLYRRKGKGSGGGNDWECNHCHLSFENSNVLNLHILVHAAEDVDLERVQQYAITSSETVTYGSGTNYVQVDKSILACPVCQMQFNDQKLLIQHAAEHGTSKYKFLRERPFKCDKCCKAFYTHERLQRHILCHGDDSTKPLQCEVCYKRFMNNSALSCHLKIHSDKKYYTCPVCHEGFDHTNAMKSHVVKHCVNGYYKCPDCERQFEDFLSLRKHLRSFHSNKEYPCPECKKVFPRPDKLKLHMLRHSSHREFMCETCGRQFKRKDKLKEHIRRMHAGDKEAKPVNQHNVSSKKFVPKVSPTDFHRFIYKCHLCMLGFKRRGMLVNHLAKRHPDINMESVPELNLPILKTQKDYYCQYCEKVYKSSSKRKAHILKNHPGSILPVSARKKVIDIPGLPNPTYSQTVGSITTMPHSCEYCHKQYASKAKLTQHQRKKHPDTVIEQGYTPKISKSDVKEVQPPQEPHQTREHQTQPVQHLVRFVDSENAVVACIQQPNATEGMPQADLLTQAMSELTHSLQPVQEYRTSLGEIATVTPRTGAPAMVQVQNLSTAHSTIEFSHLGQTLSGAHFLPSNHIPGAPIQLTAIASSSTGEQMVDTNLQVITSPTQSPGRSQANQENQNIIVSSQSGVAMQAIPVSLPPGAIISTQTWPTYQRYR